MVQVILETIISVVLVVLTGLFIPWIKAKTTAAQQDMLLKVVDALVRAAEQIYGADLGKEKFDAVQEWLIEQGYADDETVIETAIEAAVFRMRAESGTVME